MPGLPRIAPILIAAATLGGCGSGSGSGSGLTVFGASSLTAAFESYGPGAPGGSAKFSFAGSDQLAAQIRQGAKPDVYAAAETDLPDQLFAEGLVEKPVAFASNSLVLAVPADSKIGSLGDLTEPGVDLVVGAESVPVGSYAREVLGRLGPEGEKILANVRSEEPDTKSIVAKLVTGSADAGFVYITDVTAAGGEIRAIRLSPELRPDVEYAAAVVNGSESPERAQEFIDGLLKGAGADALQRAGFAPPGGG